MASMMRSAMAVLSAGCVLIAQGGAAAQAPKVIADDTEFRVRLTQPISTKLNKKDDPVVAQVVSPAQYQGSIMEGTIRESKSSGSFKKSSVLNFAFHTLHYQGSPLSIRTELTAYYNSKGNANVDEEGQLIEKKNELGKAALMSGIGAIIGAAAGGAKGAAIGAGAGAAAGLLFIKFGAKAPNISFDSGSQFDLKVSQR